MISPETALAEYRSALNLIDLSVNLSVAFPSWPFVAQRGFLAYFEYSWASDPKFIDIVVDLAGSANEDRLVLLAEVDDATEYCKRFLRSPGREFRLSNRVVQDIFEYLDDDPAGDPTGNLSLTSSRIIYSSPSGQWAIWADRYAEFGILFSRRSMSPWAQDLNFRFDPFRISDYLSPRDVWPPDLERSLQLFAANMRDHAL